MSAGIEDGFSVAAPQVVKTVPFLFLSVKWPLIH